MRGLRWFLAGMICALSFGSGGATAAQSGEIAFSVATYLCPEIASIDAGACVDPIEGLQVALPSGDVLTTGADGTASGVAMPDETSSIAATVLDLFVELIVCHADGVYQATRSTWGPLEDAPRTDFSVDAGGDPAIVCSMYFVDEQRTEYAKPLTVVILTAFDCPAGTVDVAACTEPAPGELLLLGGYANGDLAVLTDAAGWARVTLANAGVVDLEIRGLRQFLNATCQSGDQLLPLQNALPSRDIGIEVGAATAVRCSLYVADAAPVVPDYGPTVTIAAVRCPDEASLESRACDEPVAGVWIDFELGETLITGDDGYGSARVAPVGAEGYSGVSASVVKQYAGAVRCEVAGVVVEDIELFPGGEVVQRVISIATMGARELVCTVFLVDGPRTPDPVAGGPREISFHVVRCADEAAYVAGTCDEPVPGFTLEVHQGDRAATDEAGNAALTIGGSGLGSIWMEDFSPKAIACSAGDAPIETYLGGGPEGMARAVEALRIALSAGRDVDCTVYLVPGGLMMRFGARVCQDGFDAEIGCSVPVQDVSIEIEGAGVRNVGGYGYNQVLVPRGEGAVLVLPVNRTLDGLICRTATETHHIRPRDADGGVVVDVAGNDEIVCAVIIAA